MIYIPNENPHPQMNLAMEEYILSRMGLQEDVLFFFIDEPSIIVGRHQNTAEEINADYVRANGIQVARRLSGGGAVYHDFGNLCFSFIIPDAERPAPDFKLFTAPIVRALNGLGVPAQLSGRNDILVEGAKVSGNAFYHNRFGSVCHGTLLFDSDLSILSQALQPRADKVASKGIQSVRSRVANLRQWLPEMADVRALREQLIASVQAEQPEFSVRSFSDGDLANISAIADARYRTDAWNYGQSPKYTLRRRKRFDFGEIDARLWVEDRVLREVRLFGDYFSAGDPAIVEACLIGAAFSAPALCAAMTKDVVGAVFPALPPAQFIAFLLGEDLA